MAASAREPGPNTAAKRASLQHAQGRAAISAALAVGQVGLAGQQRGGRGAAPRARRSGSSCSSRWIRSPRRIAAQARRRSASGEGAGRAQLSPGRRARRSARRGFRPAPAAAAQAGSGAAAGAVPAAPPAALGSRPKRQRLCRRPGRRERAGEVSGQRRGSTQSYQLPSNAVGLRLATPQTISRSRARVRAT